MSLEPLVILRNWIQNPQGARLFTHYEPTKLGLPQAAHLGMHFIDKSFKLRVC